MSRNTETFIEDNFTNVKLNLNNLWMYQVRKNLLKAIEENAPHFKGTLVDLGCGIMPYKSSLLKNKNIEKYIGLDLSSATYYADIKPDLIWDGEKIPFEDNSVDCIMATEVLEHCHTPEDLLNEINRVLKPDGLFFCTVPFIWHLHEIPYDAYRYTPFSLEKKLQAADFTKIQVRPLGGWDSALSQLLGLWVTFRPMNRFYKSMLLRVCKIAIRLLDKHDKKPLSYNNSDNSMISGLSAICHKK